MPLFSPIKIVKLLGAALLLIGIVLLLLGAEERGVSFVLAAGALMLAAAGIAQWWGRK